MIRDILFNTHLITIYATTSKTTLGCNSAGVAIFEEVSIVIEASYIIHC